MSTLEPDSNPSERDGFEGPMAPDSGQEARRVWRPEYVFSCLLAVFGLSFALVLPPFQVPDEVQHFIRAYHVSEGHLRIQAEVSEGWGGGEVPDSLIGLSTNFGYLIAQFDQRIEPQQILDQLTAPLHADQRHFQEFRGSVAYNAVPYLPQALGIALARGLGQGPLVLMYAGRLSNLFVSVCVVFLALRVAPAFRLVLGSVCLIPVAVQQFASNSPDASMLASGMLLLSSLLRLTLVGSGRAGWAEKGLVLAVGAWLALCKFPYAILTLLYLAVPVARIGSWKRYLLFGALLAGVSGGLTLAWLSYSKVYLPESHTTPGYLCNPDEQLALLRAEPWNFVHIGATTIIEHGLSLILMTGSLGWLDTGLNPLVVLGMYGALLLIVLLDGSCGVPIPLRLKCFGLLAAGLGMLGVGMSLYLWWTPVGWPRIEGLQGRYFLPFLPLLLLPLANRSLRVEAHGSFVLASTAGLWLSVLVVTLATMLSRYYGPNPVSALWTTASMAGALGLFSGIVLLAQWWFPMPEPVGTASRSLARPHVSIGQRTAKATP